MDELHEQTVNLLAFQELPKTVFDIQVAFNLVERFGQNSNLSLAAVAQRSGSTTARLRAEDPSLRSRCCKRLFSTDMLFLFTWRWRSQSRSQM